MTACHPSVARQVSMPAPTMHRNRSLTVTCARDEWFLLEIASRRRVWAAD
jgi:hypothetical protein